MGNKTNVAFRLSILLIMVALEVSSDTCTSYYSSFTCPGYYDDYDETYCCGSGSYQYCCDFSTYYSTSEEDSEYSYYYGESLTLGASIIIGIVCGVIGFIILVVGGIAICVYACAKAGNNQRTTTVHQIQANQPQPTTFASASYSQNPPPVYGQQPVYQAAAPPYGQQAVPGGYSEPEVKLNAPV